VVVVVRRVASRGPWWRRGSEVLVGLVAWRDCRVGCVGGLLVVMCSCGGRAQDQAPVAGREEQEQSR
jgi:hypothetical protein